MTTATMGPIVAFVIIFWLSGASGASYYGKFLGKLSELHHGVSGEVYAIDGRTLYLKDFTYDGQGPAAYFYASTSRGANSAGFRLRDENGNPEVIRKYRKEGVVLTLPEGKSLNNVKIFYVWCEEFEVNFGDVKIPRNFDYPRPQKLEPLKGVHAISSDNIVIVDAQTLLIPNLSYDGEAPDAKFWVGRGPKPSPQGIRVPDENGKEVPLRRYDRKTVVLTLPGDLTVFDIGHFGIWCEAFTVDFGHVQIPQNLNVPPSLKMLGVSPQSKLNCEVLYDDLAFEARWAVAGDSIVLQLVAKLGNREYMSFGISGDDSRSEMIGGDVVVAWVDKKTLKGFAQDYHLGAKSQCSGPTGSCPDNRLVEDGNNIRLLNAAMVNGYSIVTYQRPLKPSDEYDRQIHTNRSQAIIWAIGPLNERDEVSFHGYYNKKNRFIDFGRPAKWNCPTPQAEETSMRIIETTTTTTARPRSSERRRIITRKEVPDNEKSATKTRQTERKRGGTNSARAIPIPAPVSKRDAWEIPPIKCYEPEDGVFYAQMGPTGGKRGYPAITGHVGWGISWYINGLLIPEINVVRGKTYTFVVEGGLDPEVPAKYHPFYITDDSVGGYEYKNEEERKNVKIFAGTTKESDGKVVPTGTGRLCHWTQQGELDADDFESFGAYQRTLELKCDQGEPGVIQWTPDEDTPDTVYYQCFTHRYLGWKINVHDACDEQVAASEPEVAVVPAPDLEERPSIRIETRVKPNDITVVDKEDKNNTTVSEKSIIPSVTIEPVIIHPEPVFFQSPILITHDPYFATSNPSTSSKPFYQEHAFKPSPLLETVREDSKPKLATSSKAHSTTSSTTEATISSTTTSASFTSVSNDKFSSVTDDKPLNQSYIVPQTKLMFQKNSYVMMRTPLIKRRPYPLVIIRRPRQNKKPIYTAPMKFAQKSKPVDPLHFSESQMKLRSANVIWMKSPLIKTVTTPAPMTVKKVEISPLQASTEKDFEIQTVSSSPLETVKPSKEYVLPMKPAFNAGFHPESVVVEGGFRPIIGRNYNRRMLENEPQLELESEFGIVDVVVPPQPFGPMFVPSSEDKLKNKKVIKHSRSVDEDLEPIAAAAERVDSYYLPPSGQPPQLARNQQPSAIDLEKPTNVDLASPPEIVVTYDGRRVSGASLTARIADRSSILDVRASKAAELIKARPQFAPFKGELPPLNPDLINKNLPQLQQRGVLNRDLDTPPPRPDSTKLSLVRQRRNKES